MVLLLCAPLPIIYNKLIIVLSMTYVHIITYTYIDVVNVLCVLPVFCYIVVIPMRFIQLLPECGTIVIRMRLMRLHVRALACGESHIRMSDNNCVLRFTATPRAVHSQLSSQDDADYEVITAYVMDDNGSSVHADHDSHSSGPPSIKVRLLI